MFFRRTALADAWLIELDRKSDTRGFFARTFCENELAEHGIQVRWPQCNLSRNTRAGTLRGMHYNVAPHEEAKLIRCVRGAIWDVIVDLRPGSATRLRWVGVELSADEGNALYVPKGFAHGFVTLRDDTDVFYHMGEFFQADAARGFRWNDPALKIDWPLQPTVVSERDQTYAPFDPQSHA